jgi:sugar phosphate isomerase/epimerase
MSNIAWNAENDSRMYAFLQERGFTGLEAAPTRLFSPAPYGRLREAAEFAKNLRTTYGLAVSSLQSLWFGRNENIFGTAAERGFLIGYTKQAVRFAEALRCPNLVFGCPRNRNIPEGVPRADAFRRAEEFFTEIAAFAFEHGTTIALEPNPAVYNTNFINTTAEALRFCGKVNHDGLKVNVDLGAMLYNNETLDEFEGAIRLVNHIHLSEPMLVPLKKRAIHRELPALLQRTGYGGYVSIEMKDPGDMGTVQGAAQYIREVFYAV